MKTGTDLVEEEELIQIDTVGRLTVQETNVVKRPVRFAIREEIGIQLHPNWQTVGNAGPTPRRITSTERLDRTGYQIRQHVTCDIGLKYDG